MLRSISTAASGMLVQQSKMDIIANNVSNAETSGFKKDRLLSQSFADILIERVNDPYVVAQRATVGEVNAGTHIDRVQTVFDQGATEQTDRMTDLAIQGDGFFAIGTAGGERYTRDGSFQVSSEGFLTTAEGNPVLGQGGAIQVGSKGFAVDATGNITVNGAPADTLRVVRFADTASLRKEGSDLYSAGAQALPDDGASTVRQGELENSNIDIAAEMVDMISVSRLYESNQRMIQMLDDSYGLCVSDVGKV